MSVRVDINSDLLDWAIKRAGWDQETTLRRAPKYVEWSSGALKPTIKQLEKFASDTHTPFGMLFLEQPPVENIPIPDMRTLGNESIQQPSVDLLETIYICQSRQDWYKNFVLLEESEPLFFVGSTTTAVEPYEVASKIREFLSFDINQRSTFHSWEDALRGLIDRIESIGVLVMVNGVVGSDTHRALKPSEFRGFALSDPYAPLIFINGADSKAAQIFTIIHELAHIWLGGSALSEAAMASKTTKSEELWCNQVSAEVLLPLSALRVDYKGDVSTKELERLSRKYRVSTLVVLKRIYDGQLLPWDQYQAMYKAESERILNVLSNRRSVNSGGNYYYTQPLRLSRRFAQSVISSTYEGSTSYRDAYQLLGTKKFSTFERLAVELGMC